MLVCAGIVLYNPNIGRLKENIRVISRQVREVVLVDNGSSNIDSIRALVKCFKTNVVLIENDKNYGIARALNQILDFANSNGYQTYITLDQDSVSKDDLVSKYLKEYNDNVGQISCNIIDRNLGMVDKVDFTDEYVRKIEHCITSGCINNTLAVKKCGGYKDKLFIDGVDLDLSCNLREHGYDILCINYNGLLHELGNGKTIKLFGKKISIANHSPWRNYYTRRNLIYIAKRYYHGKEKNSRIRKQIVYAIGSVLLENKKFDRIKYNFRGICDGLKMNIT